MIEIDDLEVKECLKQAKMQMVSQIAKVAEVLGEIGADKAKVNCPVDTGALKDSIHSKLVLVESTMAQDDIIAGSSQFFRGVGAYKYTRKGEVAGVKATSEYAGIVEDNEHFMEECANWLEKNAPRKVLEILKGLF